MLYKVRTNTCAGQGRNPLTAIAKVGVPFHYGLFRGAKTQMIGAGEKGSIKSYFFHMNIKDLETPDRFSRTFFAKQMTKGNYAR